MAKSPGHKKWPDHHVIEDRFTDSIQVYFNEVKIAESSNVIKVAEDDHPDRFYFPREDIKMEYLQPTSEVSECPFKGKANYFSIKVGDKNSVNAAWSYESPFDEHIQLKNRIAFYEDKIDELRT